MLARFIDFTHASPSAFHAADRVAATLVEQGFSLIDATAPDSPAAPGGHVLVDGGAVIAWWVPENPNPRFRIVGSHTDSPGLMAKPSRISSAKDSARLRWRSTAGRSCKAGWIGICASLAGS